MDNGRSVVVFILALLSSYTYSCLKGVRKGVVAITIKSDSSIVTKLFSLYHVIHT